MYLISVAIFLSVWLFLSVICQFSKNRLGDFCREFDVFSLIPRWSFFAPNPGTTDYHLLYRDKLENDNVGYWKEVSLSGKQRTLWGALWNPEKRKQKILSDAVSNLARISEKMEIYGLKTTLPYIIIINVIASLPRTNLSKSTQFIVMETYGYYTDKKPILLIRSEFHRIKD